MKAPRAPLDSQQLYAQRNLAAIAARWDAKAADWDRSLKNPAHHLNEDNAYARFVEIARKTIKHRPAFCAAQGVVDLGCGTGLVLAEVLPEFAWGMGVDISPKMIRRARAKRLPKAEFKVGDVFHFASVSPPAGAILSRGILMSHYGADQGLALLTAARKGLVTGGFLLIDFLNTGARGRFQHEPDNKTWFSGKEIAAMARGAGFAKVRIIGGEKSRCRALWAQAN